jgi:hypothetical protein
LNEQFRRQNRVTDYYDKRETEGSYRTWRSNNYKEPEEKRLPKKEELWIPKNMYSLMLATTPNSTSVHFGMNHLCKKHNKLYTLDHLKQSNHITDSFSRQTARGAQSRRMD